MLKYIIKRILVFIPTLIVISLLAFIISVNAPGDPVERMVSQTQGGGEMSTQTANVKESKRIWTKKLGLDLPVFYFSLSNIATPDTLYKIIERSEKEALERLVSQYGNWEQITEYYLSLDILSNSQMYLKLDSNNSGGIDKNEIQDALNHSNFELLSLKSAYADAHIKAKIEKLNNLYIKYPFFSEMAGLMKVAENNYNIVKENTSKWKNYIPAIKIYGNNQYHRWIFGDGNWLTGKGSTFTKGLLRGDFGISYTTQQPVSDVIYTKIGWSLFFALASVLFAYLISIPIGIKAAVEKDSKFDKYSTLILFILYSVPNFFLATLLLMTFANPDVLHVFPASGVKPILGYPADGSLWDMVTLSFPYIILPLVCYTYSSFAFLSRTMRVSMLEIIRQDYIRTARAKGLSEKKVVYKHALRNALLPIITVFANVFPLAIGGSVIIETIFTIPGMGQETFLAIQNQDYPMIVSVFTIAGFLTMVGFLISDILYAMVDPRISFSSKK